MPIVENNEVSDTAVDSVGEYPYEPLWESEFSFSECFRRAGECLSHPWTESLDHGASGMRYTEAFSDFMMLDFVPATAVLTLIAGALAYRKLWNSSEDSSREA